MKLIGLLILPLLFIGWTSYTGFQQSRAQVNEMNEIRELTQLSVTISSLVHETQKERGMTAGFLGSGGKSFGEELKQQRDTVDQRREELQAAYDSFETEGISPTLVTSLNDAMTMLEEMGKIRAKVSAQDIAGAKAIGYYTALNERLLNTIGLMTLQTTDGEMQLEIQAYQLFLKGKERAGIERAVLSNTFANDAFKPGFFN